MGVSGRAVRRPAVPTRPAGTRRSDDVAQPAQVVGIRLQGPVCSSYRSRAAGGDDPETAGAHRRKPERGAGAVGADHGHGDRCVAAEVERRRRDRRGQGRLELGEHVERVVGAAVRRRCGPSPPVAAGGEPSPVIPDSTRAVAAPASSRYFGTNSAHPSTRPSRRALLPNGMVTEQGPTSTVASPEKSGPHTCTPAPVVIEKLIVPNQVSILMPAEIVA